MGAGPELSSTRAHGDERRVHGRRGRSAQVAALAVTAVLGLLTLPRPLYGDQALFAVGARELAGGAVLYRDFWDIKQPGVYWFYEAAGRLFGFTEVGLHLGELLWQLALAGLLTAAVRPSLRRPVLAAIVPVATVGVYYATARLNSLTQVESLISLPLFGALAAGLRATTSSGRRAAVWLLLSGCAGAISLVFKLIFAPVVLALLVTVVLAHRHGSRRHATLFLIAGLAIPAVATCADLAAHGELGEALRVWLVLPPRLSLLPGERALVNLTDGTARFIVSCAPMLLLGLVAVVRRLRRGFDPMVVGLLAWAVLGALLVLAQLWWPYLWMAVVVPVGVLGVLGLDDLLAWRASSLGRGRRPTASRILAGLCVAALLGPIGLFARQVAPTVRHGFGITSQQRAALRTELDPVNAADLAALGAIPRSASMYVLGDPTLLYLADKPQAEPINGWSPDLFLPEQCRDFASALARRPPTYLFVARHSLAVWHTRCPASRDVREPFELVTRTANGAWWRTSSS